MKKQKLTPEQLAEKYGCTGYCYGGGICIDQENFEEYEYPICGNIDTCEETRRGEFLATILAGLFMLAMPLMVIGFICFAIFYFIQGLM